nr:redoxin domain-containing protein [Candidatus Poseidoniaceae archaeon]
DTKDSQWVMIEFMDTDCPYCFNSAREYQEGSNYFVPENPNWNGPQVSFLASATELTGLKGHDSSRAEIEAFRDLTTGEMCNSGNVDCSTRDGVEYTIPFIDDLDKTNMDNWKIGGTPAYFLIQPDGIIAWASHEHQEEKFYEAINRLVPQDGE